jgi:hypothetical protein
MLMDYNIAHQVNFNNILLPLYENTKSEVRSMIRIMVISLSIVLSTFMNVNTMNYKYIEVFDINKGEVVKVVQSNPKIEKITTNYLQGITGVYAKFNPIPKKGHAIRIPLKTPVAIKSTYLNAIVNEVIIMFPEDGETATFLMVFENDYRLMCFTFKGNTNVLLKNLNFKPTVHE